MHPSDEDPDFSPDGRDPRLEIPEILRKPVDHPSLRRKPVSPVTSGLSDLGKALAVGLDFLFTIAAGGGIGWFADYTWGSSPYGVMVGLGIGFVAATYRIIERTNREDRLEKERRERQKM